MAIHCTDFEALAHTYIDGELANEDVFEFESHVEECDECCQLLAAETTFRSVLRNQLCPPVAPAQLLTRIQATLDHEDLQRKRDEQSKRWSWALPGAAFLVAAAALIVFVTNLRTTETMSHFPTLDRSSVRQPAQTVAFPVDSSHVNANGRNVRMQSIVVDVGDQRYHVTIHGIDSNTLASFGGTKVNVNGLLLQSRSGQNMSEVVYMNPTRQRGYLLRSHMPVHDLLNVASTLLR